MIYCLLCCAWQNEPVGILYAAIDARRLQSIIADKTGLQDSGRLLVGYRNAGGGAADSVESLFPSDALHRPTLPYRSLQLAVANASGCLHETGSSGQKVVSCYRPVGYSNWGEQQFAPTRYPTSVLCCCALTLCSDSAL